jgi:hypothetical protein
MYLGAQIIGHTDGGCGKLIRCSGNRSLRNTSELQEALACEIHGNHSSLCCELYYVLSFDG